MSIAPPAATWAVRATPAARVRRMSTLRWTGALASSDLLAALIAANVADVIRFGEGSRASLDGIPYSLLALVLAPAWLGILALGGTYDRRFLAVGAEEFRRVMNCGVWLIGLISFASLVSRAPVSRAFIALTLPEILVLTLIGRYVCRRALHRRVARGRPLYRTVVVGTHQTIEGLIAYMARVPWAGFSVVDSCTIGTIRRLKEDGSPDALNVDALVDVVRGANADTIALASLDGLQQGALKTLCWGLEGTGIQLVVAPAMTDIAGPRIVVRPVEGLPLLHVEDPEFSGSRRILKGALDRFGALFGLVVLSPALLAIALLVKLTSRGPVFFRQERVGVMARRFTLCKFRTMHDGAHEQLPLVAHLNEHRTVLFKSREDPRLTKVGCVLRRFSLDELPQLWNVLVGQMSLVGPRPPLPREVEQYGDDAARRLLVKPGMTGLWQVSGRAELPWEESVRLDLYYVENWSVTMDLMVLWKTIRAVIYGRGAW